MREKDCAALQTKCRVLIEHLCRERIIPPDRIDTNTDFAQMVALLRQTLQDTYPTTKRKRTMKSIHYANAFADTALRECAFTIDDVGQYLARNHFLDHDRSVDFFNETITAEGFVITPTSLLETMLESLLLSHKGEHDEKNWQK